VHTTNPDGYLPGVIVHVKQFPFAEINDGKNRFALVIDRHGPELEVRGIYTKEHRGYASIRATHQTGLHHDSYLGDRLVPINLQAITHAIGEAPLDYDPYGDFSNITA